MQLEGRSFKQEVVLVAKIGINTCLKGQEGHGDFMGTYWSAPFLATPDCTFAFLQGGFLTVYDRTQAKKNEVSPVSTKSLLRFFPITRHWTKLSDIMVMPGSEI